MSSTATPTRLHRDLKTLARFIQLYCHGHHRREPRSAAVLKFCDLNNLVGKPPVLCRSCTRLLAHAFYKRIHCPLDPKPDCKHCPDHCYHPDYRREIRQVMRYSGWRMITRGRLDLLWHMIR